MKKALPCFETILLDGYTVYNIALGPSDTRENLNTGFLADRLSSTKWVATSTIYLFG